MERQRKLNTQNTFKKKKKVGEITLAGFKDLLCCNQDTVKFVKG